MTDARANASEVARILREDITVITTEWERQVLIAEPELAELPRQALVDHVPQFVEGLALWVESNTNDAQEALRLLAEAHAAERQRAGVDLETLTAEHAILSRTILDSLRARDLALTEAVLDLCSGIDAAVHQAVHRYASARDIVRERFVGILAHDLRDPLAAVSLSASMLSDTSLTAAQGAFVARIERGASRMERMITDVLDFTRGRLSGGIPIVPVATNMADVCHEIADEAVTARRMNVKLELSGDLRGLWDTDRVKQALSNLVANAFHHGLGDATVRAWETSDHRAVCTSVTNFGLPIPDELLSRLFDPFTRPVKARGEGLGLGLYIVQQVALAHGGQCRVSSSPTAGTTFTIEWPRVPPHVPTPSS